MWQYTHTHTHTHTIPIQNVYDVQSTFIHHGICLLDSILLQKNGIAYLLENVYSKISFICDARKNCVSLMQNKKIEYIVKNKVDYRKHVITCLL